MKAFLITCLLLALFLPEVANVFCREAGFLYCNIDDGFCFKHYFDGYFNGSSVERNFKMGCAANCPSTNYSFTTLEGYLKSNSYCCQDDFCNGDLIYYPRYIPNQLFCPVYHVSGPDDCPELRNVTCRSDETRCFEFVLVHNDSSVPDKVYNGCATPTFCELARTSPYNDYLEGTITKARCGDTLPY